MHHNVDSRILFVIYSFYFQDPPYDPQNYPGVQFHFFTPGEEHFLDLLGRDDVLSKINRTVRPPRFQNKPLKAQPIIISTSRGMGKTFLLKMVGMQKVKDELKNSWIVQAGCYGRIVSFDFTKSRTIIQNLIDTQTFFAKLMIFHLCKLFANRSVDGIHFDEISNVDQVSAFQGAQSEFNQWKARALSWRLDAVIDEYIRLTNIAFGVKCEVPPVFLLDEIQIICKDAGIKSTAYSNLNHTFLSLLLSELAGKHMPICVCTGTNDGNLISVAEMTSIAPVTLSLTPLMKEEDYLMFWKQMTQIVNEACDHPIDMEKDISLITALIFASYQIPRLLQVAHAVWFEIRSTQASKNREYFLQHFEHKAFEYYREMTTVWDRYDVHTLAHIMMSCGVHWSVNNVYSNVPGTHTSWSELIDSALIFPYVDNCFLFPFALIWKAGSENQKMFSRLCKRLVKNLNIRDLFPSYSDLCKHDLYKLGLSYETIFASSLAVKYYLVTLARTDTHMGFVDFEDIYDFDDHSDSDKKAKTLLAHHEVNFSEGVSLPSAEKFIDSPCLPLAVVHNKLIHNAHHDIIIPAATRALPVSAKASFSLSNQTLIENQLRVKKTTTDKVPCLIWLYLGSHEKEAQYQNQVAFIDGSGVCNGLAIDTFDLLKKLRRENNNPDSDSSQPSGESTEDTGSSQ